MRLSRSISSAVLGAAIASATVLPAGVAQATFPRIMALGGTGLIDPFSGFVLLDDSNIFTFVSAISRYKNQGVLELGQLSGSNTYLSGTAWGWVTAAAKLGLPLTALVVIKPPQSVNDGALFSNATFGFPGSYPYTAQDSNVRTPLTPDPKVGIGLGAELAAGQYLGLLVTLDSIATTSKGSQNTRSGTTTQQPGDYDFATDRSSGITDLTVGYGMETNGTLRLLEASVGIHTRRFDNSHNRKDWISTTNAETQKYTKEASGTGFGFNGRVGLALSRMLTLMAHVGYNTGALDWTYTEYETSGGGTTIASQATINGTNGVSRLMAGAAAHLLLSQNVLLFAGLQLENAATTLKGAEAGRITGGSPTYEELDRNQETTVFTIPAIAGVEFRAHRHVLLRAGLSRSLMGNSASTLSDTYRVTQPAPGGSLTTTNESTTTLSSSLAGSFGWGIELEQLRIDGVIRTESLYTLLYAASGIPNPIAWWIALTYGWSMPAGRPAATPAR